MRYGNEIYHLACTSREGLQRKSFCADRLWGRDCARHGAHHAREIKAQKIVAKSPTVLPAQSC